MSRASEIIAHDYVLVASSVTIAVFASYTALVVAGRIRATAGLSRYLWLLGAGLLMGGGIWSMHFVGMLALQMPMPVSYDLWRTMLSLALPVIVIAIGFHTIAVNSLALPVLVRAGTLMGLGIVAMHYTGMAALRMPAEIAYAPHLVGASILIAIAASVVALWLAFRGHGTWQGVAGAMTMGAAIAGMHYTAIAGAHITPVQTEQLPTGASLNPTLLAIVITSATFVLLFVALLAALFDDRSAAGDRAKGARIDGGSGPGRATPSALGPAVRLTHYSPKFALLVIALFFVTLVGVSWGLAAWSDYRQTVEQTRAITRNTARLVEEHAERTIGEGDLVLRQVSRMVEQFGIDRAAISDILSRPAREMVASLPHLGSVWVFDARGELLLTTEPLPPPYRRSFADRSYFQAQQGGAEDEFRLGQSLADGHLGRSGFTISRRLTGPDGGFAGVVLAVIRADYFTDFYRGLSLGSDSAIGVFRTDGAILTRQPMPPDGEAPAAETQLFTRHLQRAPWGTFEARSPLDGVERIVSYRQSRRLPVVVTASIARDAALTEWRSRLHRNTAFGLLIGGTLIALSWLAVRSLQREEVAADALRLAHADLDRRVQERTSELQTALADKEILFKEVHHRVKNNLQVICSLLSLQSSRFREEAVRQAFQEAYNRVYSISLVHKALYDQSAAAQIDFGAYLRELCDSLANLYDAAARGVAIEVSKAEGLLDLNRAVPLALIVNEVVSNALKHAFPEGRTGRIAVEFAVDGPRFRLSVCDDGVGIPEAAARGAPRSLGLVIINALANQIDATASVTRDGGTRFELSNVVSASGDSGSGTRPRGADAPARRVAAR